MEEGITKSDRVCDREPSPNPHHTLKKKLDTHNYLLPTTYYYSIMWIPVNQYPVVYQSG